MVPGYRKSLLLLDRFSYCGLQNPLFFFAGKRVYQSIPLLKALRPRMRSIKRRRSLFQFYCRAVSQHFSSALHHHCGGKTNVDNRISAHGLRVFDHSLKGLFTALRLQARVFADFSTDDVFQTGKNITTDVACADRAAARDA
jgi:hypothetical protein